MAFQVIKIPEGPEIPEVVGEGETSADAVEDAREQARKRRDGTVRQLDDLESIGDTNDTFQVVYQPEPGEGA